MELLEVHVEGISALLQHNPSGMIPAGDAKLGRKTIPGPEEEALAARYVDDTGRAYHPSSGFRGALMGGAKGRRLGKMPATTVVKGAVFAWDDRTYLTSPDGGPVEYLTDLRRVVLGSGKSAAGILRGRARIDKWAAVVSLEIDPEFITADHVRELLSIGGRTIGVGDFRPEKSGPFGRFRVL